MKKRSEALMRLRQSAGLDGYPLPATYEEQMPAQALVITCSESPILGMFAASLDPLLTLQNFGGVPAVSTSPSFSANGNDGIDPECGTIEYALDELAIRHIVFCGHSKCRVPALMRNGKWPSSRPEASGEQLHAETKLGVQTVPGKHLSQVWLVEQMARLNDWLLGATHLGGIDIATHALWFDEDHGDIFAYVRDEKRFLLMSDIDMDRLFDALESGHHRT